MTTAPSPCREIASKDPKDLSVDASGTRCFAGFLVEVGGALPELVLPVVSVLMPHLTGDSYTFRNGVLGVMGHLLLHLSKGQGSLATNPRDQLLNKLMEHVYDSNAFVRVKVLQILEQLVTSQVGVSTNSLATPYSLPLVGHSSPLSARDGGVGLWETVRQEQLSEEDLPTPAHLITPVQPLRCQGNTQAMCLTYSEHNYTQPVIPYGW